MKNACRYLSFFLLINYLFAGIIYGQNPVLNSGNGMPNNWQDESISVLVSEFDENNLQSIQNIPEDNWLPLDQIIVDDLKKVTWTKFSIYNPAEKSQSLALSYLFMIDTVSLYFDTPDGLKLKGTTGFYFPYNDREVNTWMPTFLINVLPHDTVSIYLRNVVEKQEDRPYILYPNLENSHFVRQDSAEEAAFQFSFLGIIMVFVILGIIAFFIFKERGFIYYSALNFCFAMNAFLFSFIHHLYIEPRGFWDTILMHIPFLSFLAIFFFLFISNRLELTQRSYRLYKIYKWTSIIAALAYLIFYISDNFAVRVLTAAGTSIVILIFALFVIAQGKRQKHSEANSLLLSMSILIVSSVISSIIWLIAPEQDKFEHIGHIGLIAFAISLLYSLFKRITSIKLERLKAKVEKEKSDELLFNILPEEIALELKNTGKSEAKHIEQVSVLFTDFKGFTKLSDELTASQLIDELQFCFEAFDKIVDAYSIEKIKTIGDAYMAAGGIPIPSIISAKNTVLAALEMQTVIAKRKESMNTQGKPAFEMRVGIHTGSVVSGIIGVKKYQFDIWGNTVNIASRMESSGEVGKVNISQSTYALIKDDPIFKFENRGKIEAKGIGETEMYFVSLNYLNT